MTTALPRLHGHHQPLQLRPMAVRHLLRPAPTRQRNRLHHLAMAFALGVGVTALLLTVAAFTLASQRPASDHAQPTASAQAPPTPRAPR